MSWSLPRLYLRPQRTSRSREFSVSRPDFCTAILRRGSPSISARLEPPCRKRVAATPGSEVTSDAPDGGYAHPGVPLYLAVRQPLLQQPDHRPAVGKRLQLGRRAQVAEESAAFLHRAQRQDGLKEAAFGRSLLSWSQALVRLHRQPLASA